MEMANRATALRLDRLFRSLADPTRRRLLNLMASGEVCVCYFVAILGQPQPTISRHLAHLRRAGLVSAQRQGKWMHYRLTRCPEPEVRRLVNAALAYIAADPAMRTDRARLNQPCCGITNPALRATLAKAPPAARLVAGRR